MAKKSKIEPVKEPVIVETTVQEEPKEEITLAVMIETPQERANRLIGSGIVW